MTKDNNTKHKFGKVTSTTLQLKGNWVIVEFKDDNTVVLKKEEVI